MIWGGKPTIFGNPHLVTTCFETSSPHGRQEYSFLQLDNGLKAIIGSDPACDKALGTEFQGIRSAEVQKNVVCFFVCFFSEMFFCLWETNRTFNISFFLNKKPPFSDTKLDFFPPDL